MMGLFSLPTLLSANHRHPGYFGSDLKQHVPEDHLTILPPGIDFVRGVWELLRINLLKG
jgi:hypothetical protein